MQEGLSGAASLNAVSACGVFLEERCKRMKYPVYRTVVLRKELSPRPRVSLHPGGRTHTAPPAGTAQFHCGRGFQRLEEQEDPGSPPPGVCPPALSLDDTVVKSGRPRANGAYPGFWNEQLSPF